MKGDQPKRPRGARGKKKGKTDDLAPAPIDTAVAGEDAIAAPAEGSEEAPRVEAEGEPAGAVTDEASDDAAAAPEEPENKPTVETATEEPTEEHPVTSIPPPPESSEQMSAATPAPAKGKRGKKAPAAPPAGKTKGKRGKAKSEPAPPESSKKLVGETEPEETAASEDTWHGSDPEATVNLRGELADLFPLRDDDIVLTETDDAEAAPLGDGTSDEGEAEDAADDEDESLGDDGDEPTAPESAEAKVADPATTARDHLRGLIEALVFASDKPLSVRELSRASEAPSKDVKVLLEELRVFYKPRGIQLDEVAGGFVFRTNAVFAPFVRDLTKQKPVKLTRAQLETLAILAYRQPITRPEIDDIRGVDSGPVLKMLLERDLVRILGKKDEPGRPLLYGSTPEFLEFFGLKSLKDLPTLQEFTELNEDSKRVAEKELGESFDDLQTLLDHGEEEGAPETAGTTEAHDTEIPPAFSEPGAEDDWDGAPPLDDAASESADTDAPEALAEDGETEEPEPPTQDQDAPAEDGDAIDAPPEKPTIDEGDDAPIASEEDPNLDEAPSVAPDEQAPEDEEEDDYDDDDFEDDDDDDDDDEDEDDDGDDDA